MVTLSCFADVTLPPISVAPWARANAAMPRPSRRSHFASTSSGRPSATVNQSADAPIDARSLRFTASALWPTSSGENVARVKCTSSTTASVVTQVWPRGDTTAQSSPGPDGDRGT